MKISLGRSFFSTSLAGIFILGSGSLLADYYFVYPVSGVISAAEETTPSEFILNPGHAYVNGSPDTGASQAWLYAEFKVNDVNTQKWVAGPTRSSSYKRSWGFVVNNGNLYMQGYNGSATDTLLGSINSGEWQKVVMNHSNGYHYGYLNGGDMVQDYAGSPGSSVDLFGIGIVYANGSNQYGDPSGMSFRRVYFGTGSTTSSQRSSLLSGTDPRTIPDLSLSLGWEAADSGENIVEGAPALITSGNVVYQ